MQSREDALKARGYSLDDVPKPNDIFAAAVEAAELCAANLLRVFARDIGRLSRIRRVIKVNGYVNRDPDFADAHRVIHGASRLLLDVLGQAGRHARAALGMAGLPLGASVEVEMIVAVEE